MVFSRNSFILILYVVSTEVIEPALNCRERSGHLRQDGALCFEIPQWQHQPVELEKHLSRLRDRWGNKIRGSRRTPPVLVNSEVSQYMDTVLAPYLDTYHRNIQTSYQQLTGKMLKEIKNEIGAAIQKKQQIYTELNKLADDLKIPSFCDEERRAARTIASQHVAHMYTCTEKARASIAKMGRYAEVTVNITRNHMLATLDDAAKALDFTVDQNQDEVKACLKKLSRAAVALGYELDLSLTNARRYNEQSCEKLTSCSTRTRRETEDSVAALKEQLYQCVYA